MRGGTKEGDKVLGEWPFASVRGGRDERRQHKDWTERGRGQSSPLIKRRKSLGREEQPSK